MNLENFELYFDGVYHGVSAGWNGRRMYVVIADDESNEFAASKAQRTEPTEDDIMGLVALAKLRDNRRYTNGHGQ